jgi:hypothetical protein
MSRLTFVRAASLMPSREACPPSEYRCLARPRFLFIESVPRVVAGGQAAFRGAPGAFEAFPRSEDGGLDVRRPGRWGRFGAMREYPREGSFMLDRHIDILQRLQTLSAELIEVSGRDTSSLTDEEIEALTRRLEEIRVEIARLRESFKETLN